jgi:hypothetical protein
MYTVMGVRNRHEKAASERKTQDSPHTPKIQHAFWCFRVVQCVKTSQNMSGWSMDQKRIEWGQGHPAHVRSIMEGEDGEHLVG